MKKKLSQQQEFEIMKLVLDKFLWLGLIVAVYGVFKFFTVGTSALWDSLILLISGAVILLLLMIIIVREYEIIK